LIAIKAVRLFARRTKGELFSAVNVNNTMRVPQNPPPNKQIKYEKLLTNNNYNKS
jgi:hypothetical protein